MADALVDADGLSLRLLVVEDEALVAMLVEDALVLHGHSVVGVADTAAAALAIAEREQPDMALCDVRLLDGDSGLTVAAALAERGVICLFMSGNCPASSGHPLIIGCLAKPFHTARIGVAVRAAHAIAIGRMPADVPAGMALY